MSKVLGASFRTKDVKMTLFRCYVSQRIQNCSNVQNALTINKVPLMTFLHLFLDVLQSKTDICYCIYLVEVCFAYESIYVSIYASIHAFII